MKVPNKVSVGSGVMRSLTEYGVLDSTGLTLEAGNVAALCDRVVKVFILSTRCFSALH